MADILQEMLKVEEKAQEIVKEAQKEADKIVQDARIEADKIVTEAKSQIQKEAEEIVAFAIEKAKTERDVQISAIKEEDKKIEEGAQRYIKEAVEYVVKSLAFNEHENNSF